MQAGVDHLVQVVGRDVGRHPHRDTACAVAEQVRERRRQHHRLGQRAVVVGAEIDRVLGQPVHQRLGRERQPRLGVAAGGGAVAVDRPKVALPVHQRVAHHERLRQTRHRVVDRAVAVGVEVPHHVARDLGRLAEPAGGRQPQLAHRVHDPAMHRLQPVAGVGQGAVHDRGERIGQVTLADRARQRLGAVAAGQRIGARNGIGGRGRGGIVGRRGHGAQGYGLRGPKERCDHFNAFTPR